MNLKKSTDSVRSANQWSRFPSRGTLISEKRCYLNVKDKLTILADAAKYDASCASSGVIRKAKAGGLGNSEGMGICHSFTPDGRCVSLLKILLTNSCIYDCSYCINRVSSQVKRAKFTVEEVVDLTLDFYRRNYIEGLFLSSGVFRSSDQTMIEMVEIARQLREIHSFGGYIHLKAVAGSSQELIEKAGLYADRLSVNIELPTQDDLNQLAPAKTHREVEKSMGEIQNKILESEEETKKTKRAPIFARGGQSTQMIVGATLSSDQEILKTSSKLYQNFGLKRVYYSAFSPIPDSDPKLPLQSPPLVREHRLYQADWLFRFYEFKTEELFSSQDTNLDLKIDPKLSWALKNRHFFPVDLNRAPKSALLRVPGLGVKNVLKILELRRLRNIRFEDLGKMHVAVQKIKWFVTTDQSPIVVQEMESSRLYQLLAPPPEQLSLFG